MFRLFIFLIILVAIFIIALLISYFVHIEMVKTDRFEYGYGTFKQFLKHFTKYDWKWDSRWESSLEYEWPTTRIHADIFSFEGKGFIFNNPISYLRAKLYIRQYIKNKFKPSQPPNKIDWASEQ
jgi:hypothetical protein